MSNKYKSHFVILANTLAGVVGSYNIHKAFEKENQSIECYKTRRNEFAAIEQEYEDEVAYVQEKLDNLRNVRLQSLEILRLAAGFLRRAKIKDREIYEKVEISKEQLTEWTTTSFQLPDILTAIGKGGVAGLASSLGVYELINTLGKASTGTPISSLKGVAADNATRAWLGGGPKASGGGGIELGNKVLKSTWHLGILVSSFYMKHRVEKLATEADDQIAQMDVLEQEIKKWIEIFNVICQAVEELENSTMQLTNNLKKFLKQAKPKNFEDAFQVARMAKSLGILLDTPIFDKLGIEVGGNMSSKEQKSIITVAKNTAEVAQSFNAFSVITEVVAFIKVQQEEATKREAIAVKRDSLIKAIQSEKELIENYFNLRFAERREALHSFFEVLRNGVANNDSKMIDSALTGIMGILQDSPLQDLEKFRVWFYDLNHSDIEL